jgi:hydrogenase-4 transcriptional activator
MTAPIDFLRLHLRGLRERLGASAVGVFVTGVLRPDAEPLHLLDGDAEPPAEVASPAAALERLRSWEAESGPRLVPGRDRGRWLVVFAGDWFAASGPRPSRRRFDGAAAEAGGPAVLIGLSFADEAAASALREGDELSPRWAPALTVAAAHAVQVQQSDEAFNDPLTGLPTRAYVFAAIERALRRGESTGRPFAFLLVNPDEFDSVNERLGREAGDRALRETAARLRQSCRDSDVPARYGSAIFACVLPDTPRESAGGAAERACAGLKERPFLDGALRLTFSAGVAACDPRVDRPESAADVVRWAQQALSRAKKAGGGAVEVWQGGEEEELRTLDRLSGIFTGSLSKDYRNICLLWDAVSAMAGAADFAALAARFVEGLTSALRPATVAIVDRAEPDGSYEVVHGLARRGGAREPVRLDAGTRLGPAEAALLESCRSERRSVRANLPDAQGAVGARLACAVPLVADGRFLGALYLDGPVDAFRLDSSDLMFLGGLASPLAVARDRAQLAEQQRRRADEQRRLLAAELETLRRSLRETRLLHRSASMDSVLAVARRVAPTDATVLVTGESGTGKELLARTLHEMSPRRKGPFVVVDCGALPATLMESELFGHERGAFTGAEGRRAGRLAEAEHGTVVLDEIGELPLEVQSKLLRFVQERQVTPVGGRPRPVDARLVAATHRDLRGDVAAGRFREDLFYRLNVVHLDLPPLRERTEDILPLAEHYLERYAQLYARPVRRFSADAAAAALAHHWPGNVRELQNRVMQAVILCEGSEVRPEDLLGRSPADGVAAASSSTAAPADRLDRGPWDVLRVRLARVVDEAVGRGARHAPPLGRWLDEDLVLAAHGRAGGVLRRAAALVGVPEATFRRRYDQAARAAAAAPAHRSPGWDEVRACLDEVVQSPAGGHNRIDEAGELLLQLVESHPAADLRLKCALVAVTPPTYRLRVAALDRAPKRPFSPSK